MARMQQRGLFHKVALSLFKPIILNVKQNSGNPNGAANSSRHKNRPRMHSNILSTIQRDDSLRNLHKGNKRHNPFDPKRPNLIKHSRNPVFIIKRSGLPRMGLFNRFLEKKSQNFPIQHPILRKNNESI